MVSYSGRGLNDLGLYHQCEDIDNDVYTIFEINKDFPVFVIGQCFPDACLTEIFGLCSKMASQLLRIYHQSPLQNFILMNLKLAHFQLIYTNFDQSLFS